MSVSTTVTTVSVVTVIHAYFGSGRWSHVDIME